MRFTPLRTALKRRTHHLPHTWPRACTPTRQERGEGDMFDLITGKPRHLPSHAGLPIFMSTTAQALAVTAILVLPALFVAEQIPANPSMKGFCVSPHPPPSLPP